jgi:hypothetical protein
VVGHGRLDARAVSRSFRLDPHGTVAEIGRMERITSQDAASLIWAVIENFDRSADANTETRNGWVRDVTEMLTRRGFFVPVFLLRQQAAPEIGTIAVEVTQEVLTECAPALTLAERHPARLRAPRPGKTESVEERYERTLKQARIPGL